MFETYVAHETGGLMGVLIVTLGPILCLIALIYYSRFHSHPPGDKQ